MSSERASVPVKIHGAVTGAVTFDTTDALRLDALRASLQRTTRSKTQTPPPRKFEISSEGFWIFHRGTNTFFGLMISFFRTFISFFRSNSPRLCVEFLFPSELFKNSFRKSAGGSHLLFRKRMLNFALVVGRLQRLLAFSLASYHVTTSCSAVRGGRRGREF